MKTEHLIDVDNALDLEMGFTGGTLRQAITDEAEDALDVKDQEGTICIETQQRGATMYFVCTFEKDC